MKYVCEMLQIDFPIIQGGMGNISNAQLTAAVSEAGGLGTIGCGTMTPSEVEKIILQTKAKTNKKFAINIAINVSPYTEELIDLVIKHNVPVVSLSAGNPVPFIAKLHEHGVTVIALVASVKHAQKAEAAGVDILVAEGFEAAGINSTLELTTFTLIPQIVKNVKVPVIAAGGIGDGKGLAAALMLGASGVQIGTRLIATKEAPFHEVYKQSLVNASDTETLIVGRSVGMIRRMLKTPYSMKLDEREKEGMTRAQYSELTTEKQHVIGAIEGDMKNGFINSGQIAGLIDHIPYVKELIESMIEEASNQISHSKSELDFMIHKQSNKK
ncbi:nitronate monooxygenase family protein [Paenisporosarcina sp. OV554]|uniref:NAD(P)H-dependent flavin oxidoreductase n=1 Tax=Paenisporosarcina sp. OV554 TaxID=2135694 RepID=UPI000D3D699C|nr:nitronate monooxygenase [Paenisporosarcina sp. OV554]PUB13890.1 enoyl-[acyl-carrier protein] reductase II [Paenisporosarcina sp. OV554]